MKERIHPPYKALHLLRGAGALGICADQLLEGSGLTPEALRRPCARISLAELTRLYVNAARLGERDDLGLLLGERLSPTDFGPFGCAIASATSLGDALEIVAAFPELETPAMRLTFEPSIGVGRSALLGAYALGDEAARRFATDLFLSSVFTFAKALLGPQIRFSEILLEGDAPAHMDAYRRLFECACSPHAARTGVVFPSAWLYRPLMTAHPKTHALMRRHCAEATSRLRADRALSREIAALIERDARRFASFDAVAAEIGASARTLRRRLDREGCSFKALLDQVRLDLAVRHLKDDRLSAEETARRLGYSDAANFRTAFKRWTGQTVRGFFGPLR